MVPRDRVEEATARMLELFPEGFAEEGRGAAVELTAFTDEAGAERLRESFRQVTIQSVSPGWEDEWKRFHQPVEVGSLWIGPPWEPASALKKVVIDPGRAFGTGAHPTTQLCIEILHDLERGSVLDIGCGSGVLAIAASMLGFGPIVAIDSDAAAVEATKRNAAANDVVLDVQQVDVHTDLPDAEIVLANIDLPTLATLVPPRLCRMLVTSGYYENDRPDFPDFDHRGRRAQASWAADLFIRE